MMSKDSSAGVWKRPSLCENSNILPNAQTSTAQIALYSILLIRVMVEDLPNGIAIWVFTQPRPNADGQGSPKQTFDGPHEPPPRRAYRGPVTAMTAAAMLR
jgi:hypothetical protein